MTAAPIAITGAGVIGPTGLTAADFWRGLQRPADARSRWPVRPLDAYPVDNVVPIAEDTWAALGAQPGRRTASLAEFTVTQALEEARVPPQARVGCVLASTTAGVEALEHAAREGDDRPGLARALDAASVLPALKRPWRGPTAMLSTACSSGLLAPAMAIDMLLAGEADAMVAGGLDVLLEYTICGFNGLRLATPERCRAFGAGRRGVLLSEGAASLCFEPLRLARARHAPVKAVVSGVGLGCDARHVTAPDVAGVARTIREAIDASGVPLTEIGAVFTHGTGTVTNDEVETAALREVFGALPIPPLVAIKPVMGHPQAAAGAFSLLAAVCALQSSWLPPVAWLDEPDPALGRLDPIVGAGRALTRPHVLVNAFGFGGNNCVMVVSDALWAAPGGIAPEAPQGGRDGRL